MLLVLFDILLDDLNMFPYTSGPHVDEGHRNEYIAKELKVCGFCDFQLSPRIIRPSRDLLVHEQPVHALRATALMASIAHFDFEI